MRGYIQCGEGAGHGRDQLLALGPVCRKLEITPLGELSTKTIR